MVAIPLLLVLLTATGYTITAIRLSVGFLLSAALIFLGVTLYWFSLRWFRIRERRLALADALEQRQARKTQDPQETEPPAGGAAELVEVGDAEEESLDLDAISDQTRQVLSVVFGLLVVGLLIWVWNGIFPLGGQLTDQTLPVVGSLLGVAEAVLIIAVTYVITTNLPGLLELSVLQATKIESGTRHAIATLCQYAVIGAGLALLLEVLDVDWAQFSWIAAALSVGLGFGLQEVVANFVCGLILLFERPIRVGDIVTVEGMSGTVTRIKMRATTITDWDRQEFVVPNKNLITGTLLNWTLTAAINRIAVPVGVAYGTDTEKAREIMLGVANKHPHTLKEPAPMALFEGFGDSSLNLRLLAFLPNLQNRLSTITELHAEIDREFAAAGIQIPFPQRDIHVRNGVSPEVAIPAQEAATRHTSANSGTRKPTSRPGRGAQR